MCDSVVRAVRDNLAQLASLPATSLDQQDLQSLITALAEHASGVAALTARLTLELSERGTAVVDGDRVEAQAWLAGQLHADRKHVNALIRRGDRLAALPLTGAALAAGRISVEQADAISPITRAIPDHGRSEAEQALLGAAHRGATANDLAMLRQQLAHRADPQPGTTAEQARYDNRYLRFTETPDGSLRITGQLDPIAGAQIHSAVRSYSDPTGDTDLRQPEARMADALHHLCATHIDDPTIQRRRPDVIVLVPLDTMLGNQTAPLGRMADTGALISSETAQQLACTSSVRRLVLQGGQFLDNGLFAGLLPARLTGPSEILDLGRTRRLASNNQWIALIARDGGCTYPSCTAPPSMTEVHHLNEWHADHGTTDLDDLALLCRWHPYSHDTATRRRGSPDHIHQQHQHLARDRDTGTITVRSDPPHATAA